MICGFHETIDNKYLCDYNNVDAVIEKINELVNNRPKVNLDDKFYDSSVIEEWTNLLNSF